MTGPTTGRSDGSRERDQPSVQVLRARERRLVEAQRLARLGSWEWDLVEDRTSWSDELYQILGLRPHHLQASVAELLARVHPEDRPLVEGAVARARTVHEPYEIQHRLLRADGSICVVEARGAAVVDGAGAAVRVHGAVRELTDRVGPSRPAVDETAAVELVRAVALALHDAHGVRDAVRVALGEICRHRGWPLGRGWFSDASGRLLLSRRICYGDEAERGAHLQDSGEALRPGVGLAGRSLQTRRPEWGLRGPERRSPGGGPTGHAVECREVLALPVVVEQEVVAVLEFFSPTPAAPDDLLDAALCGVAALLGRSAGGSGNTHGLDAGQHQFRALVASVHDLLLVIDDHGTIRCSSPSATELLGQPSGAAVLELVHPDDQPRVRTALRELLERGGTEGPLTFRVPSSDGSWQEVEATGVSVADVPAVEGALVVIARDSSGQRPATTVEEPDALHDRLTGLADRALFVEQVARALERRSEKGSTAVLTVDIDEFRKVNEEFGHDVGDGLLIAVAQRLRTSLRQDDTVVRRDATVARLGADQFLVLCEDVPDAPAVATIAARLLEAVGAPLPLGGRLVSVTASAGIALAGEDHHPERLILDAEAALHEAKGLGGARYGFFSAQRHDHATAATALSNDLRRALERDQLHLVYQPKVSLVTDRIIGVEALLRWDHPQQGPVPPAEFIPAAEASGVVVEIGAWVLGEACRQGAAWHTSFPLTSPLSIAINVSGRQFRAGLADTVRAAITDSGIAAAALFLEVTETTVMDDVPTAITVLAELKALGLAVSIDDFGTGYSSLAQLRRLPIDEVKIDKSFVDGLVADSQDTAIVAAVISLAHALDRDVVAEGVETREQLEKLRALGCDSAQGYYLARPVSASELGELLAGDAAGRRLPRDHPGAGVATGAGSQTVLVADDAADVRQLARMSLTAAGFTVAEVADGASALATARRLPPDCVLLDVRMPDMTGIEVCRALRSDERTASCTIVILTSRADAADKAEAFSAGADDYIVKPFAPRDLVGRVRAAVRRRRQDDAPV